MFEQERLRGDGAYATGAEQLCAGDHQVNGEDEDFAHRANGTITTGAFKTARRRRITSHYEFAPHTHVLQPGTRHPLGVGAGSLAMLAALDNSEIERCLEANAGLLASSYPGFSPAMLRNEVTATRKRGFSVNEGLVVAGSWGIGVAVHGSDGDVIGALSIAAVESRLQKERRKELGTRLIAESKLLEKQIQESETIRGDHGNRSARRQSA